MIRWPKPWLLGGLYNPLWEEVTIEAKEAKRVAVEMILEGSHDVTPPSSNQHLIERIQVADVQEAEGIGIFCRG